MTNIGTWKNDHVIMLNFKIRLWREKHIKYNFYLIKIAIDIILHFIFVYSFKIIIIQFGAFIFKAI